MGSESVVFCLTATESGRLYEAILNSGSKTQNSTQSSPMFESRRVSGNCVSVGISCRRSAGILGKKVPKHLIGSFQKIGAFVEVCRGIVVYLKRSNLVCSKSRRLSLEECDARLSNHSPCKLRRQTFLRLV